MPIQFYCLKHNIWISFVVCDVLYKKKENDVDEEIDEDASNSDDDETEDPYEEFLIEGHEDETDVPDFADSDIAEIIKKVRKIVTWFHKSPKQSDKLRKYTKEDCGQDLVLKKDKLTAWNQVAYTALVHVCGP